MENQLVNTEESVLGTQNKQDSPASGLPTGVHENNNLKKK